MVNNFILENMEFSFSSASTYKTCPYSFKLTYLDMKPRIKNFYGDYGLFMHKILEMFFKGELSAFELSSYYSEHYDKQILTPPPPFPVGIGYKYKESGQMFFDNFEGFENIEVVALEEKIKTDDYGISIVIKPDLILRNTNTSALTLVDFKTANPYITKTGKIDKKKFDGYMNQLYVYSRIWKKVKGQKIDNFLLWFVRMNRQENVLWSEIEEGEVMGDFLEKIASILSETDWLPNTSNPYFCGQICSVREDCEHWKRPEPRENDTLTEY